MPEAITLHGDSLEVLKTFPDNSVDSIVTDPPYGLSFMGKKWDYDVPSVAIWKEALRVLKPGGHLLSFGGTRTYHRMVVNIEDAGFEIRDQIMWIYGSGFPKSMNVGKQVPDFKGWGTALKPANEPIVLARKPLSETTVAKNVLKWGTGAINVDASRIGTSADMNPSDFDDSKRTSPKFSGKFNNGEIGEFRNRTGQIPNGRWPANVLFDESAAEMLDEQVKGKLYAAGNKKPAKMNKSIWESGKGFEKDINFKDFDGGASRFFYVAKTSKRERNAGLEALPEKEKIEFKGRRLECTNCGKRTMIGSTFACGCDLPDPQWIEETKNLRAGNQNHHPTVKPIKLMEYLCKLITPPGGVILDPFMGSGSTGCAAVGLNYNFIGIEREAEYVEIAEKRIANAQTKVKEPA